ncbi:substrate-binding periplasmic protein [candidate division CSSED10-310 bacterium]|uniref:Substrate-binding periplasmic protein n=1 Tax=candidate division CSSED10-310 bacterium TaxID=2855610 RepID=A0ABV6Z1H2_UNCC1
MDGKRISWLVLCCLLLFPMTGLSKECKFTLVYQGIMEKKEIRVGISKDYPPLNFEAGKKGLEVEMANLMGTFLGVAVKLVPLDVKDYVNAIAEKKVDIVMAGLSRNLVRAKTIWFSTPYLSATPAVLAKKHRLPQTQFGEEFEQAPITTIWDLRRLTSFTFAVKKGSSYENLLADKFPDMPKVFVTSNEEGLKLLKEGKVHGFVHDSLYLQYLFSTRAQYKGTYTLLKGGRQVEEICVGLPFGDIILKNQIDLFVQELLRQGQIDEWLERFNLEE